MCILVDFLDMLDICCINRHHNHTNISVIFYFIFFSQFQVFDVALNGEHTIVHELDIFSKVGRGVAHDEIIPFSIRSGKLKVNGETSTIIDNKISLDFIKVRFFLDKN